MLLLYYHLNVISYGKQDFIYYFTWIVNSKH